MSATLKNQLLEYVKTHENKYYSYFKNSRSNHLMEFYIQHGERNIAEDIKDHNAYLNKLHSYYKREISELFEFAANRGILIIGLKGAFLESELYESYSYPRSYYDLDLFMQNEDVPLLAEYFAQKSYSIDGYTAKPLQPLYNLIFGNIRRMKHMNINKINHLELVKAVKEPQGLYELSIEIHTNFNILGLSRFPHKDMMKNSRCISLEGKKVRVLSELDGLIFLCHHLIRHLPYVFQNDMGPLSVSLDKLYDLGLYLEKYPRLADSTNVQMYSKRYDVVPYTALAFYLIHDLFPSVIKEKTVQDLIKLSYQQQFPWKKLFKKLMKQCPIEIITGTLTELPELVNAVCYIERNLGPFEEYTKARLRKIAIWRRALKSVGE